MPTLFPKTRNFLFKLRLKNFTFSNKAGNNKISKLLLNSKSFAVSRIGLGEQVVLHDHLCNKPIQFVKVNPGGVWPDSYDNFLLEYAKGIKNADINIFWGGNFLEMDIKILKTLAPNSKNFPAKSLEPYFFKNPWSYHLKGKKVLIIHPFVETIKSQYAKRELIWSNTKILPDFELITYKSRFLNDLDEYKSWTAELEDMKKDIANIDFDVALLGCGTIGLPLVSFIKTDLSKGAIYIGGALQLLFGIKGGRWSKESFPEIYNLYNDHWVFPAKEETPSKKGRKGIDSLTAYWDPSEK